MLKLLSTNGSGDRGSVPGHVIPKTQKMVLDASLLNTQHYKEWTRGKWSNPGKGVASSPLHIIVVAIKKSVFRLLSTMFSQLTYNNQHLTYKKYNNK